MTDETFAEIVALLSRAYGQTYDGETKRVWRLLLDPLPDDAAREAAVRLCQTSPYPPKPADLFRLVHGAPEDAERRLDEEAELAIAHLERWISDHRLVDLGPILNAVVRAMNGPDAVMARMVGDEWKFERARCRSLYKAIRRRGVRGDEGRPLIPAVMAEHLTRFPLDSYRKRGIPLPMVTAHFALQDVHALPAGAPVVLGQSMRGRARPEED